MRASGNLLGAREGKEKEKTEENKKKRKKKRRRCEEDLKINPGGFRMNEKLFRAKKSISHCQEWNLEGGM